MRNIFKYLKKLWQLIIKYIYMNRLFISYVLLALLGSIFLRELTIVNTYHFKPLITDLGIILAFGSIGYLFKPKNQYKYFFTVLIVFTVVEVINSIYYTFFEGFVTVSLISTLKQTETVADSIFDRLRLIDFIYVLQPIIFYFIHKSINKTAYYNYIGKVERKKTMTILTAGVSLLCILFTFATAEGSDYSRLVKQWNRAYLVDRFGILLYQSNDVVQSIIPKINSLFGYDDAVELFNTYFMDEERNTYKKDNKYTGILDGYNIVYVHMESMQTFLMDLEFNGETVTPNLNKLASEGMFFSNFYPQVSTGTSSDAEYIMLTGLMPASTGTVFVNYSNNTFRTIAQELKERNYYTFSMHGNLSDMWNRKNVHPKLGYMDMFFKESFTFNDDLDYNTNPDVVGLGISDKLFFQQAIPKLEEMEATYDNYFGTIITLSNHSPFPHNNAFTLDLSDYYTDPKTLEETSSCYLCERNVGKYIASSHYADEALGEFISYIKNSDYFNNTIFVFYGDHDAKISYKDMNYLYNYDYTTGELKDESDPTYIEYDSYDHNLNKKTPLIMWTKNKELSKKLTGEVDYMMGMYDVIPTLYNMLDIDYNYVLGHDIFNIKDDNIIIFPNGNFLTEKVYYNNSTGEHKTLNGGVDEEYLNKYIDYTEKTIDVGNAIITYDLFNQNKRNDKKE